MLKLQDVSVRYGGSTALESVCLEVHEGEIVSLIGSNGAGKSTVLKAISGIVRPTKGSIQFGTTELTKLPANQIVKQGIIHVPEGRRIFPELTVYENLEMGASLRRDKANVKKEINELFERFPRLRERSKQPGGTMSGGEQQMLALVRGLLAKPRLLMLDEPSLGIAPLIVKEIMSFIASLNKEGMTILLIEQNANMAIKISNRTYVLETGSIFSQGRSEEMLKDDNIKKAYLGA
ncbi:ABC transporter ATP-binding protein [Bacillus sp. MRMR6]|uniref:ABC transporter ATP-binding protein n=1 Tax=Bacillus sp. MRMR6 TaxID=1928617 RepID=UPI0009F8A026|nr:ABC transporter ATP-binding protein [Bacillus sp. MRMR6]